MIVCAILVSFAIVGSRTLLNICEEYKFPLTTLEEWKSTVEPAASKNIIVRTKNRPHSHIRTLIFEDKRRFEMISSSLTEPYAEDFKGKVAFIDWYMKPTSIYHSFSCYLGESMAQLSLTTSQDLQDFSFVDFDEFSPLTRLVFYLRFVDEVIKINKRGIVFGDIEFEHIKIFDGQYLKPKVLNLQEIYSAGKPAYFIKRKIMSIEIERMFTEVHQEPAQYATLISENVLKLNADPSWNAFCALSLIYYAERAYQNSKLQRKISPKINRFSLNELIDFAFKGLAKERDQRPSLKDIKKTLKAMWKEFFARESQK